MDHGVLRYVKESGVWPMFVFTGNLFKLPDEINNKQHKLYKSSAIGLKMTYYMTVGDINERHTGPSSKFG